MYGNRRNALPDTIVSAMDEIAQTPNPRISERVFVDTWMPLFVSPPEANVPIIDWISVAGSWHTEVDIVDGAGNVVATVPPLLDPTVTPVIIPADVDLQKMTSDSIVLSNLSDEARANNLIVNTIFNKNTEELDGKRLKVSFESVEKWNKIYLRYGAPHLVVDVEKLKRANTNDESVATDTSEGFQSYEDV